MTALYWMHNGAATVGIVEADTLYKLEGYHYSTQAARRWAKANGHTINKLPDELLSRVQWKPQSGNPFVEATPTGDRWTPLIEQHARDSKTLAGYAKEKNHWKAEAQMLAGRVGRQNNTIAELLGALKKARSWMVSEGDKWVDAKELKKATCEIDAAIARAEAQP